MLTVGEVDSESHLELWEDPEAYIKNNPASRLPLVTSLELKLFLKDDVEEIGEFIGELTQLIRLKFVWCKSLKSLPMSIANLSKLTFLSLYFCDSLVELPANIGQLVSLTHLKLQYCSNIKSLPMSIANLSSLTFLSLFFCDSLDELPANIGQLVSLSHLQLYGCNNIKSLPDSMKDLCSLDTLFIDKCDSLAQLPIKLNVLHLKLIHSCPHFHPTGLINLKYLRATVCSCSDESFANWKDPYSLQHLSISGCFRHNNYIIIKVPARLNQFVNLQVLSLHNPIRFVELPANLDGLAHLCLLDIQPSNIKCLPWSITKLRKLQHLMLPEDFIRETLPYELNNSVIISVKKRHVRKSWEELKTEIGELPIPFGGEIGNDAAQNPSIISPPGYLRLEEDDDSLQWIASNRNLLMLVRFLDLEIFEELTDSIMQFSELTHLYLYINDHICLPDNYFVTFTRLTHLSLHFIEVVFDESVTHSLSKLSNLQTLHLRLLESELSENFNMPVSLKHLSLSNCDMRPLYDSLEKLTNLRSLDLNSCYCCDSLPPRMYIHKLRLVDCSFKSVDSLPIGLHHLEILFFEDDLSCIFEDGWNKLVNLETLSITCSEMEFFPEDIARLQNLQKLLLKDCISLKKLPSNIHELVNLHTLDISVTRIKILPPSFVKLRNLQHLILPKCFNFERLPRSLKQVSIIDDTEEAYYKSNAYDASLYQASASDESENEVTKLIVVPGESCNEDYYLVPTVEIHETVPDEQTSADPFNSISMGSIEHITTEQGGISQIYKDSHFNVSKDPIDENIQHTALCSQNQFNPLGDGGFMTNRPGAVFFGVNNQHVINDGQFDSMTLENEHGIASICQKIPSWDGNSIVGGWNNHHALDLRHNNNSQNYHANVIRQEKEITPEAILEPLPRFVNAAEKHDDLCYNIGETSNPSGESSHAIENTITTETEQGIALVCDTKEIDCGEISHHALESEQNHIPQSNNVRVKMKRNNITLEMLQSFWSNHTKLVDAAEELGVTRSTFKRRIKELGVKRWPRKGKKQQPDAKKRKHNNKAPFETDCSQQNLVNLGSSAAHAENVECIMGSDLHTLPNHVSSNSNVVINLTPDATMETIRGNLMETIDSHQGAEVHLNGANERTLSDTLPQNEKSSNFIVKARYNDDIVRFDFSLSKSIDQLKEEIANQLELEVNTFKIKYQDEDKDWVLLTRISNLEHALNLSRSSRDSSVVRLLIVPKT